LDLAQGGHRGQKDKSLEQELTEETEVLNQRFLLGCRAVTTNVLENQSFPLRVRPLCSLCPCGEIRFLFLCALAPLREILFFDPRAWLSSQIDNKFLSLRQNPSFPDRGFVQPRLKFTDENAGCIEAGTNDLDRPLDK
jgi:hypothetical protein